VNFISAPVIKSFIIKNKQKQGERKFITLYLSLINLPGMIGATGILISGITMTALNPGYGFFQMTANHWLAAKQIIMIVLLLIIFVYVIPIAKKIRAALGNDLESSSQISEAGYRHLAKMYKLSSIINYLVLLNFLLAVTHRFFR
jgi:uncharacterized membrane protein